jgi:hypothetical protein
MIRTWAVVGGLNRKWAERREKTHDNIGTEATEAREGQERRQPDFHRLAWIIHWNLRLSKVSKMSYNRIGTLFHKYGHFT